MNQLKKVPIFLMLKKSNKTCGCILIEIVRSDANRLYLDRYKQEHLKLRSGDSVDVEEFEPN